MVDDCLTATDDRGFVDEQAKNLASREDAPVLGKLPGWEAIPLGEIGLYGDGYRTGE